MNTTILEENASLLFKEDFIKISDEDLKMLWDICPTIRHEIKIMGKMITIPRFQKAFGKSYKYSGSEIKGEETPEIIKKIIEKIQKELFPEFIFNNVLANWYTDGTQYIGFHSDNTKPFQDGTPIVGITFCENEPRKLVIKKKNSRKTVASIKLKNGSCYIMKGNDFQKKYLHGLPKQKKAGKRISLTFRCFKK
jgi:alkylated DNA repair dioxygenase AlkB